MRVRLHILFACIDRSPSANRGLYSHNAPPSQKLINVHNNQQTKNHTVKRNPTVRAQVLTGAINPTTLVAMKADDFLSEAEQAEALRKGRHSLVLSAAHTFSEVLFDVSI